MGGASCCRAVPAAMGLVLQSERALVTCEVSSKLSGEVELRSQRGTE